MTRPYFALALRDGPESTPWGVAFGDYDRATVEGEWQDYLDNGSRTSALRILKVTGAGRQADIDAAIGKLNAKRARLATVHAEGR